jgi:hypothetical protein
MKIDKGLGIGIVLMFVCSAFFGMMMNVSAEESKIDSDESPDIPLGGMSDILDFDGDLGEWIEQEVDTPTGSRYMIYNNHGGFWADAEKAPSDDGVGNPAPDNPGDEDDLLCWAATAANMMEYTGWGFAGGMDDTDEFLEYYIDHTTDYGSKIEYGLEWWFNGNLPTHTGDWSVEDVAGGNFWAASYTWSNYVPMSSGNFSVLPDITSYLTNGYAVGLGIHPVTGPGGHGITCWGYNYDSTKNPITQANAYYQGVWVSDSDSHKGNPNPDDFLRYYEVEYDSGGGFWYMPNYGSGWKICAVIALKPFPGEVRPISNAAGPYSANEGSTINFNATGTSDPDGDALQFRWDYNGDGVWDTLWSTSSSTSFTWHDDFSGDVYCEVFDGRLRDMDISTVTVNNVAPSITASGDTINENGVATVSGTISDPSGLDTFTVDIDWGDGDSDTYSYPGGSTSYSETHQYLDDDPSGTVSDTYSVTVTVTDDDGGSDTAYTSVTVNNVAPSITASGDVIDEDSSATVSGTITDPGTQDTFTVIIDWGEGSPVTYNYPAGSTSYSETHQYLDDNPTGTLSDIYGITVTVTDDDTESDSDTTTVTVNNVDPVTTIDVLDQPNPQFILPIVHTLDFTGSFTDVGTQDTHTAVWDWGDSTTDVGTLTESGGSGTVTGSHVYMAPGFYTVTLTVTDDDGGYHSGTFLVEVVDAHGALDIMNDYIQSLDDSAFAKNPANQKNAFSNMINALHNKVDAENYKGAIQDMQKNLRNKVDGTMGGNPNNDWIVDGSVQYELTMKLDDISAYLATF